MNSYQKLKQKCDYLQEVVNTFQKALTIVRQEPKVTEDFSKDSVSLCAQMFYSIMDNQIEEDCKRRLTHWVATNLDRESINRLLDIKDKSMLDTLKTFLSYFYDAETHNFASCVDLENGHATSKEKAEEIRSWLEIR